MKDERVFIAPPEQWQARVEVLGQPARMKPDLAQLYSVRQELDFTTENSE
jgi:hypothetical protein